MAAACLYALDHHVGRLAEDHANARILARGLAQIDGISVEQPDTNLVFFDLSGSGMEAEELAGRLRRHGILISTVGRYRARACTHLDVTEAGVREAITAVRDVLVHGARNVPAA